MSCTTKVFNFRGSSWLLTLLLTGLLALPVQAQVSTASINGTVRDSLSAVIPQAELILRNLETGVERHTVSNSVGNYVFLNISPGRYTLRADAKGFRPSTLTPFTLTVNQTATFDFMLEVGTVEQAITVEARGSEVQASTAELGGVIVEAEVVDLPLNGRNFTQLLTLTPGASPISVGQNSGGGQAVAVGELTYPSINGQSNRSNNFMTDGTNNTGVFMSTYAVPPIIDAIQEFKVQSHNDQAEFGMATGGTVNVVTKSGTNEFHGTAWEFLRNDALDARNFFRQDVTPLRQNMYGATLGGPIIHNKTFFFVGYQGYTRRTPADSLPRAYGGKSAR
jgi:hypothetical protein